MKSYSNAPFQYPSFTTLQKITYKQAYMGKKAIGLNFMLTLWLGFVLEIMTTRTVDVIVRGPNQDIAIRADKKNEGIDSRVLDSSLA